MLLFPFCFFFRSLRDFYPKIFFISAPSWITSGIVFFIESGRPWATFLWKRSFLKFSPSFVWPKYFESLKFYLRSQYFQLVYCISLASQTSPMTVVETAVDFWSDLSFSFLIVRYFCREFQLFDIFF